MYECGIRSLICKLMARSGEDGALATETYPLMNCYDDCIMHAGFPGALLASINMRTPTISSKKWVDIKDTDRDMATGPS